MPFPSALTGPQQITLETSGWWTRVFVALNPNEVVFRAQAAESLITDPFITFLWDSTSVGAYTSVWEGMVCYLSHTTDIRDAYYRGRVRLAPSATQFFIDQNASLLNDNDYVIVTRDTDLFARVRNDTLVDGSIVYHSLPPQTNGFPASLVLYDSLNVGTIDYTPVQTGLVVDAAASSIVSWAWDVSGTGVSNISNAAVQHPTITFQAGYHYLLRVIYTDDLGTSNYQIMHVYAVTRTFSAPVLSAVVAGAIDGDLDDGWTSGLTAYADVSTLIDRTHAVVFQVQHFGDNSSTPLIDTILMCGRIRSDSIQTEGNSEAGVIAQVTFAVEGVTAYLRRLRIPNDIIRPTVTPDEWGEITNPTPYRMAVYELWAYSTLTNLGSLGVEAGAFATWTIGGEPRGIDGGYALDVLTSILTPIKAFPNWASSGEIFLAITTSYRVDRSGVILVAALTLSDMLNYTIDRDSSRTIAQVIAWGGSFNSASNTFDLYSAQSPSIVYGDGGEPLELTREILAADASITDAAAELSGRASNEYAYKNPKPILKLTLYDSWSGVLIPTNYLRWAVVIPASSNTLGVAYTGADYWYLQSVSLTINDDGTIDTSIEAPAETDFSDAQTIAALLPFNLSEMNPVLPVLPNDPAFPTDPLENYPTDTPGEADRIPLDPFSGMVAYSPLDPGTAAQVAQRQGKVGCKVLQPNFRSTSNTTSSWTTILNADYLMSVSGFTKVSSGIVTTNYDFTVSDYGVWQGSIYWPDMNLYRDSSGYHEYTGAFGRGVGLELHLPSSITATLIQINYTYAATGVPGVDNAFATTTEVFYQADSTITPPTPFLQTGSHAFTVVGIQVIAATGSVTITSATIQSGTGTTYYADAFYQFELDGDGAAVNAIPLTDGLYIDNSQYGPIPPFNPNHLYANLAFTGTGNPLNARMVLDDPSAVQSAYLTIEMCRKS